MNLKFQGEWKSLKDFEWNNIPQLAIITGINGVGKTQFLTSLFNKFIIEKQHWNTQYPNFDVIVEGVKYDKKEVGHWTPAGGSIPNDNFHFHFLDIKRFVLLILEIVKLEEKAKFQSIQRDLNDDIQKLNQLFTGRSFAHNRFDNIIRNKTKEIVSFIETESGFSKEQFTSEIIIENFPFEIIFEGIDIINQDCIEMIFYIYQYNKINGLRKGKKVEEFGEPPWLLLNTVIQEAGLPYFIPPPDEEDFNFNPMMDLDTKPYSILLKSTINDKILNFRDLSGGEKIIMSLAFLLYYAKGRSACKKLLLMDEPDAHLHPSLAKNFFDVIYNFMVKKYGVRVIMTTHSPTTLAMVPDVKECEIFEMRKEPKTVIIKADSVAKISSLLTGGLITVNAATKFVLVEDDEDAEFYKRVLEILKSTNQVDSFISIVFISSGNKKERKERVPGGKTVVKDWTEKLKSSGLNTIISGLVDKDKENDLKGLYSIKRHSIENYLLDPLIIFGCLMENEEHPEINGVNLQYGELHKIGKLNFDSAQKIVDLIIGMIENNNGSFTLAEREKIKLKLTNGLELEYPKWLILKRGHDLMNIFRLKLGEKNINFKNLINSMRKIELVPEDLKILMIKIWNE